MEGFKKEKPIVDQTGQIEINFNNTEDQVESYEKEKKEIARFHGILDTTNLIKKDDGKWYMHGLEVSEYIETMSGNENSELYKMPSLEEKNKPVIKNTESSRKIPKMIPFDPEK
jgi:hypothetical protein